LDVVAVDEGGEEGAVGGLEVTRCSLENERGDDEHPEVEPAGEPGDRHGDQHGAARDVGADHHPAPVAPVGDEAAVQAEDEGREAVGEPHGEHAERAGADEREPHQCDVVEGVAELADNDRRVGAPEVAPVQQAERARRRQRRVELLFRQRGDRICHDDGD
jgi:hypothetical protein